MDDPSKESITGLTTLLVSQARLEGKIDALLTSNNETQKDIEILYDQTRKQGQQLASLTSTVQQMADNQSTTSSRSLSAIAILIAFLTLATTVMMKVFGI